MDETLICLVQRNDLLYNSENKYYNDSTKKEEVWTQIGKQLNRPGARCKARWNNLRDQYRRALRNKKNVSGAVKRWKFEDEMEFLQAYFQEREPGLCPVDGNDNQSIELTFNSDEEFKVAFAEDSFEMKKKTKKSKNLNKILRKDIMETQSATLIKYITEQKEKEDLKAKDADDSFFTSMAQTVKSFSPMNKNIAKRKIFEIISTLEMEEITNANTVTEREGLCDKVTNETLTLSPFKEETVMTTIKMSPKTPPSDTSFD